MVEICRALEINPRAYYRWKKGPLKPRHGGGGGRNKIRPCEEKKIVAVARKRPGWPVRKVAYSLEKMFKIYVSKSTVAMVMKKYGLNHPMPDHVPALVVPPGEMLLHEPWSSNLLWGMDWTWVRVDGGFRFLLLVLDWYSRKIVSWGLHAQITQWEVVAVVTRAVASEKIDLLPVGALKPRIVADHSSANTAAYTRQNIEVQGLELWPSGIGRPTGNARTERVMGTLKREEIYLQEQYASEEDALRQIGLAIKEYNNYRPNEGNGGFAPQAIHISGRWALMKQREEARLKADKMRRKHWEQEASLVLTYILT